jgi:hypothetical protein
MSHKVSVSPLNRFCYNQFMAFEPGKDKAPRTVYSDVFSHNQGYGKVFFIKRTRKLGTIAGRGFLTLPNGKVLRAFRSLQGGENAYLESQVEPLNPFNFVRALLAPANDNRKGETKKAA